MRRVSFFIAFMTSMIGIANSIPTHQLSQYINDGCIEPITTSMGDFPKQCFPYSKNAPKEIFVPDRVLNWGSNGLMGKPWQFDDPACNEFYINLHRQIAESISDIRLDPFDLFHAHLIGYGQKQDRLLMVFHAKEYPADMESIKNYYQSTKERFFYESPSFQNRNFIYLSHDGENKIFLVHEQGLCSTFFADQGLNQLSEEKIMNQFPSARRIGDVNIFLKENIGKINYTFYSGINEYTGKFVADLEAIHSGKSIIERITSNFFLNHWATSLSQPMVYFLTGYNN